MAVEIRLTVKDDGTATIEKVDGQFKKLKKTAEDSGTGMGAVFQKMKTHWLELSAGALAAGAMIRKAWDMAADAADFEESTDRIDRQLRKYKTTADELIPTLKDLTSGQLSSAEAARLLSQGLAAGLNPSQVQTFIELAETLSDVTGGSIASSFEQLTTAISTGMFRSLKSIEAFAPVVDEIEKKTAALAASTGRQADEVTELEKRQVAMNIVMGQARGIIDQFSDGTASASDKMNAFKADLEDVKLVMGQGILVAAQLGYGGLQLLSSGIMTVVKGVANLEVAWFKLHGLAPEGLKMWEEVREAASLSADDLAQKAVATFDLVLNASQQTGKAVKTMAEGIVKATEESRGMKIVTEALAQYQRDAARAARTHTEAIAEQAQTAAQWGVAFGDSAAVAAGGVERVTRSLDALGNKQMEAYALVTGQAASMGEDRPWNGRYDTPNNAPLSRPGSIGGPLDNPQDMFSLTPMGAGDFNSGVRPTITGGAGWTVPSGDFSGLAGSVPMMAEGGIVRKPTLVMAGEAGPEAIVPLDRMGGGTTFNFYLYGMTDEQFVRDRVLPLVREAAVMKGRR